MVGQQWNPLKLPWQRHLHLDVAEQQPLGAVFEDLALQQHALAAAALVIVERTPSEQDLLSVMRLDEHIAGDALEGIEPVLELLREGPNVLQEAVLVGKNLLLIKWFKVTQIIKLSFQGGNLLWIIGGLQIFLKDLNLVIFGQRVQKFNRP